MVHIKVIRVVHPFRCYHVIFARDNCRMVVYGYKPDTLVAVATLWLHYGYIMATLWLHYGNSASAASIGRPWSGIRNIGANMPLICGSIKH